MYADHYENARENSNIISDYNFSSQLYLTEKALQKQIGNQLIILRLGGLFGEERILAKFLSGKKNLSNPNSPVNIVHQEDVISVILKIIDRNIFSEIYNICCETKSLRAEFYTKQCVMEGLPVPEFNEITTIFKKVNSQKVKKDLNFTFKHNF